MPVVVVEGIVKEYPGVTALAGVSLDFQPGEVHGLIGENGAGKSTLMKILAGVESPTSGTLTVGGAPHQFRGVQAAMAAGIAMIHQELNLVDDLSVADNIFLGRETSLISNRKRTESAAYGWLADVGAGFAPSRLVKSLSLAEKQLVEIAKAVSTGAEVLIMDEPTAVLSKNEKDSLFTLVARLKAEGKTVILISHLLGELIANCDRISVLRDGVHVGTVNADSISEIELAQMMVGRELGDMFPVVPEPSRTPVLRIAAPSSGGSDPKSSWPMGEIVFHSGEIVGFAGLIGSGRTEMFESILGLRTAASFDTDWEGQPQGRATFGVWNRRGAVYVSEDRKGAGLHLDFSVADNIALPWLSQMGRIATDQRRAESRAEHWREALSIKISSVADRVGSLSGGNQQKVSLAKWLEGDPKLIVLDEPTRGVDVGSKAQIYAIIAQLASEGRAIAVVSSEMNELIGLCHRIVVMRNGDPVAILDRSEFSEESIMRYAAGVGA